MGDFLYLCFMNYQLIHDSIIDRAKTRVLPKETYTERHHIIPRCMGGTDDKSNLVDLTAKEHFIIHKLLVEIYPNEYGLILTYYLFVNGTNKSNHNGKEYYRIGVKEYERVKIFRAKVMSTTMTNSTEDFLLKATTVHNDTYDYSKTIYKGIKKQVTIICKEHGEFTQSAHSHILGRGCKECGKNKSLKAIVGRKLPKESYTLIGDKLRKTTEEFTTNAKKIHGDFYDYSNVDYKRADSKVKIICPIHGEFLQTPNKHLNNRGCGKCGRLKQSESIKKRLSTGVTHHSIKVLNKDTNEIFGSISNAAKSIGMKSGTLWSKLKGGRPNDTPFIIID